MLKQQDYEKVLYNLLKTLHNRLNLRFVFFEATNDPNDIGVTSLSAYAFRYGCRKYGRR